jgi:hypothetical protein
MIYLIKDVNSLEVWKPVVGYEGLYEVSNYGNVKSLPYKLGKTMKDIKILNFREHNKGYLRVSLYKEKQKKDKYVHRLVAEAFLLNKNQLKQVNHKDGNKKNNYVENLEWIDSFGNMKHAWDNGLMKNVSKNLTEKWGKSCKLVNVLTKEVKEFDTWESLSLYLGYNKHWLSKAYSSKTNFTKSCLKKGYNIVLEED